MCLPSSLFVDGISLAVVHSVCAGLRHFQNFMSLLSIRFKYLLVLFPLGQLSTLVYRQPFFFSTVMCVMSGSPCPSLALKSDSWVSFLEEKVLSHCSYRFYLIFFYGEGRAIEWCVHLVHGSKHVDFLSGGIVFDGCVLVLDHGKINKIE